VTTLEVGAPVNYGSFSGCTIAAVLDANRVKIHVPGVGDREAARDEFSLEGGHSSGVASPTRAFKVGDRVRVRATVDSPRYGWGAARHGLVGQVMMFDSDGDCKVKFGETEHLWTGLCSELEVVPPGSESAGDGDGTVNVGDSVRVRAGVSSPRYGWGVARPGLVGLVIKTDSDGDCEVMFDGVECTWTAACSEVEVVQQGNESSTSASTAAPTSTPDPTRHSSPTSTGASAAATAPPTSPTPASNPASSDSCSGPKPSPPDAPASSDGECKICLDAQADTVPVPCGHMAFCNTCAKSLQEMGKMECPICRAKVNTFVRVYRS